jgi:NADH-quinone oxidoreductase subunit I
MTSFSEDPPAALGGAGERTPRHTSIALDRELCTSCIICVVECPAWCIHLTSHPEPVPDLPAGARIRTHQVLDTFTIDYGTCLYCGICIEECPFDALAWDERLVPPPAARTNLVIDPTRAAD